MADKELAAKLAKRLAFTGEESEQKPEGSSPPPVPEMPKKVVENPYVASDPSFSVDELILKALEVQEENNNYQTSLNSPPSSQTSPASPSKSPLPPKQTIRDWILKDQPQPVNAVPKNPIVPVEHHKPGVLKKASSPEEDGSELERKLAAQRAKKSADEVVKEDGKPLSTVIHPNPAALAVPVVSTDPVINAGPVAPVVSLESRSEPVKETETGSAPPLGTIVDTTPLVPAVPVADKVEAEPAANLIGDICRDSTPEKPEGKEEPSSSTIEARKTSFEELEEQMQKEVEEEERRKAEEEKKAPAKPPRSLDETVVSSPTAQKKQFVPSPLLMEAIRQECGLKSPPPPTAPKPQTPTNSRPQSPVVTKKSFVSPLGLLCDPLMSIEAPSSPKPQSPKPKAPEENPEELEKLLERQRKINDGDVVPQFVNRKMSIYAEFSEFTRKQIKSLTETFKKYDEDGDGFIDFMELKRMMEKLGEAQTHIALKEIIKKVDEDQDGKINLREFFLLFRLAAKGELGCSEVFNQLAESIDVSKEGVLAAASFFQAKIAEQTKLSKFEEEIKQEQDEKKREEEEKRARREKFQQSRNLFH